MDPVNQTQPSKQKLLIVEDELFIRELYVSVLQDEGYSIDQAADGEEAFNAMHKGGYDLVLLDIRLPKMDGISVLEKLQADPPLQQNKAVVLLTNLDQELTIAKGVSMGIRGYLIKSQINPGQLKKEVETFLSSPAV